jgi:ribosome-associated heat shock protein Hsp15
MLEKVRLDKFLWAVRLFKTRPEALAACNKSAILVNNTVAKPSRSVVKGDTIEVKDHVIFRSYKVLELLEKRVGAKIVDNYITETTSQEDLLKLKVYFEFQKQNVYFEKPGRPTKKDRRDLDKFFDE